MLTELQRLSERFNVTVYCLSAWLVLHCGSNTTSWVSRHLQQRYRYRKQKYRINIETPTPCISSHHCVQVLVFLCKDQSGAYIVSHYETFAVINLLDHRRRRQHIRRRFLVVAVQIDSVQTKDHWSIAWLVINIRSNSFSEPVANVWKPAGDGFNALGSFKRTVELVDLSRFLRCFKMLYNACKWYNLLNCEHQLQNGEEMIMISKLKGKKIIKLINIIKV